MVFPCNPLQIHPSSTYATLLPFSVLNYDPSQADELYDVCIQHIIPHISRSISKHSSSLIQPHTNKLCFCRLS